MSTTNKVLFPALVAVGGHLATVPAAAIELGEVNVHSTLGEPLRASIAYALAPSEELANYCVSLNAGLIRNGLPPVSRADVSVANGVISIVGRQAVREPLMTLRVDVACPYTPRLSREYMLFIDPPTIEPATVPNVAVAESPVEELPAVEPAAAVVAARTNLPAARPAERSTASASRTANTTPIDAQTRYRVQVGDSLSEIAQRIENRPIGLWAAVMQIFEANPEAFIDNDPNKLKAGSWLTIPNFGAEQAVFADAQPQVEQAPVADTAALDLAATADVAAEAADSAAQEAAAETTDAKATTYDWIIVDEKPIVPQENVVIPDTGLEAPETAASPNTPVATIATPEPAAPQASVNWLLWLVGGGLTLIVALLAFGRRNRVAPPPHVDALEDSAAHPMRRRSDTKTVEVLQQSDYEISESDLADEAISDDEPTEENLALDADLSLGAGLSTPVDIDVAEDFGFSTALDLELPEEKDVGDTTIGADAIPTVEQSAILESTILENAVMSEDDDYDMSVIVDATKMPRPDEVTEHDLQAIVVEEKDDTLIGDSYTISQEADYRILEQDYEHELTATQAMSKEIEAAAAELAVFDETGETEALPLATVTQLDPTKATANETDPTAEITQEMTEEITQKIVGDDETVEMTVESGKVDTKAG